ncbi:MAG: glucuronate isomerase [Candidatus Hydrogenedentes bacterium]|nr:glucuronate isomerase [Candidatus Hydrogenedentota bacterium]
MPKKRETNVTQGITESNLQDVIKEVVSNTPITDVHTHLYAPSFGNLLLWGIDELLTYHYLVAEFFRTTEMPYSQFWALSKREQANLIWQNLFVERSPISEACRGVITVLHKLGLDTSSRDLNLYREWFQSQSLAEHVNRVFELANLKQVVMTNDPFDPVERDYWHSSMELDKRFLSSLRLDVLILKWAESVPMLQAWGYSVEPNLTEETLSEVRRFLSDWVQKIKPIYMAVSLPPSFEFPEHSTRGIILEQCILPVARYFNIPLALMIGVLRGVNPELKLAGDGVGRAEVRPVERLCEMFPQNKFMVTFLSRENTHSACVSARKFRNLMPFGCWWFLNNPSLIEEMTAMRLELLGTTFIPQHSDARVLEQVIYKWAHTKQVLIEVLKNKYLGLMHSGWKFTKDEIQKDVNNLLTNNFWRFIEVKF